MNIQRILFNIIQTKCEPADKPRIQTTYGQGQQKDKPRTRTTRGQGQAVKDIWI